MIEYDFVTYFFSAIIVYSSTFAGHYLAVVARKEIEQHSLFLKAVLSLFFILIFGTFIMFTSFNEPIYGILITFSAAIVALFARLHKDIFFVFLATVFSLSYVFNAGFFYIASLTFIFGIISSSLNIVKTMNIKRTTIRRLPFVILTLFGYLLTLAAVV